MDRRRAHNTFTPLRLLRDFVPIDLFFKALVWWAFMNLMGLEGAERWAAVRFYVGPALLSSLVLFSCVVLIFKPLSRWANGDPSDDAVRAAFAVTLSAPRSFALLATVGWVLAVLPSALVVLYATPEILLPRGALAAVIIVQVALVIGALTLGYLHMQHAVGSIIGVLSVDVRQRGLVLRSTPSSMRLRNAMFALGITMGPTLMLTSMSVMKGIRAEHDAMVPVARQTARELVKGLARGEKLRAGPGTRALVFDEAGVVRAQDGDGPPTAGRGEVRGTVPVPGGGILAVIMPYDDGAPSALFERLFIVFIGATAYALLSAMFLSTNMLVTVRRVAHVMQEIARAGRVTGRGHIPMLQRDELGVLVESANGMIERLEQAQTESHAAAASLHDANTRLEERVEERTAHLHQARSQLADAARKAGMAEVAAAVLHNVGNVLNSVNVSTAMLAQTIRGSKLPGVERALALLPADDEGAALFLANDPRGRRVPEYLRRIALALADEQATMARELGFLEKNVEHIKVIVALQLANAKGGGLTEMLRVAELFEDAVRFSLGSDAPPVLREITDVEITVDRHRLFQILVNLLRNARDAVRGLPAPHVVVRARSVDDVVLFEVGDNGCGIAPEHLVRIFNLGFTTKSDGNGYGLHSSALAARELGGELAVHSDGPGRGTTFSLRVPMRPAKGEG